MKYIAHRGDHLNYPENSLKAITEALLDPCWDGVEMDIRFTSDNICVVFHDHSTLRMCGQDYIIKDNSFDSIKHLRFLTHPSERIPTLNEVLDAIHDTHKIILIEIKDVLTKAQKKLLLDLLKQYSACNICLISFHLENKLDQYPFCFLSSKISSRDLNKLKKLEIHHINVDYSNHSKEVLMAFIQKGFEVSIWTNDVSDTDYESMGITYFTSNIIKKRT